MVLVYASGWVIVPGALLGIWFALRRPATRLEQSFAVVAVLFTTLLVAEAGLLQANAADSAGFYGVNEIKERYVFYVVPLAGICFALYARRGWPARVAHLALAAALVILSVRVPLSGFAIPATIDASPILFGVYWLTGKLGGPGNAAGVIAAAVGVMSGVAVLASRRPRLGTPVVLGLALLATGAASAGAVALDVKTTSRLRTIALPSNPSWVDSAHVGPVTMLQSASAGGGFTHQELFWNRSITRVALLPGATKFDVFRTDHVRVDDDGSLSVNGRPLGGPLLVETFRVDRQPPGCSRARRRSDGHAVAAGPRPVATPAPVRDRALRRRVAGERRRDLSVAERGRAGGVGLALHAAVYDAGCRDGHPLVPVRTRRAHDGSCPSGPDAERPGRRLLGKERAGDLSRQEVCNRRPSRPERAGDEPGVHAQQVSLPASPLVLAARA